MTTIRRMRVRKDRSCDRCEKLMKKGDQSLVVSEDNLPPKIEKFLRYRICLECGMKERDIWMSIFESMDLPPARHEAERLKNA